MRIALVIVTLVLLGWVAWTFSGGSDFAPPVEEATPVSTDPDEVAGLAPAAPEDPVPELSIAPPNPTGSTVDREPAAMPEPAPAPEPLPEEAAAPDLTPAPEETAEATPEPEAVAEAPAADAEPDPVLTEEPLDPTDALAAIAPDLVRPAPPPVRTRREPPASPAPEAPEAASPTAEPVANEPTGADAPGATIPEALDPSAADTPAPDTPAPDAPASDAPAAGTDTPDPAASDPTDPPPADATSDAAPSTPPANGPKFVRPPATSGAEPAADPAPAAAPSDVRRVSGNRVNLREGPGTDTPALALLSDGDEVAVLATDGGWLRVKTESGLEGWIAARFVAGDGG